ncbi:hypothetical protein GCM10012275_56260 [Longimycelium tulufanense]|uniref:Phage portal protein n=1 Tax=Longimycelium tulufanense TaxID=907463 RepID=A0A8J3CHZ7_9PSEU|nr:hypothetical protein GCM10012275_56260 [Longimycelium tulufanense]
MSRLLGVRSEQRQIDLDSFTEPIRSLLVGSYDTQIGMKVTPETALRLSTVYACVNLISSTISTLPATAHRRDASNQRRAERVPMWVEEPFGPLASSGQIEFRAQTMVSLLLHGNAYWLIQRNSRGLIQSMTVVDPGLVSLSAQKGQRVYRIAGETLRPTWDLEHLVGIPMPGEHYGLSPIRAAAQAIGVTLAAQSFGARFFGNSAMPSGIIEAQGRLTTEAARQLMERWRAAHGRDNTGGVAVLSEGATFKRISLSPEEAQFLAVRQFGVADIARLYLVPPHLIGDATGSTSWGSGLAEQNIGFAQHCLRPWVSRLEAAMTRLARSEPDRTRDFEIRLQMGDLLRGSPTERSQAAIQLVQYGIRTPDEIRAEDDLPPHPEGIGSVPYVPLNMGPLGSNNERAEGQAAEQEWKAEIARLEALILAQQAAAAGSPEAMDEVDEKPDPEYPPYDEDKETPPLEPRIPQRRCACGVGRA